MYLIESFWIVLFQNYPIDCLEVVMSVAFVHLTDNMAALPCERKFVSGKNFVMKRTKFVIFALVFVVTYVQSSKGSSAITYDELFNTGVDAYMQSRWYECMSIC